MPDRQLAFYSILLFALALQLITLFVPHNEIDEVIYLTLAEKVTHNFSDYTLQGTELLAKLPKATYDHPLFLRPPLFVYLLAIFGIFSAQVLLPVVAGLAVLWITFSIARKLATQSDQAILGCLLLAVCPILLFSSARILIDALLAMFVALSVLVTMTAVEKSKASLFVLAGVILGLAVLTKETGVLVSPVLVYLVVRGGFTRDKLVFLACLGSAMLLISAPWFLYHHALTGTFFRGTEIPDENLQLPFIKMMVERGWYYYFVHTAVVAPVYLFGYFEILERLRQRGDLTEIIWAFSFIIPLMIYGFMGNGYQMRYILPAIPALALLAASALRRQQYWWQLTAALLLAYQLLTGILNIAVFRLADIFSPFQFLRELLK